MDHAQAPPPPVTPPHSISPSFSASLNLTSLTSSLANTATSSLLAQASALVTATTPDGTADTVSWLAMLGHGLLAALKAVPGILVWTITFTTITLPTLLFALFSTSLTFTMNFTTLYAWPQSSLLDIHPYRPLNDDGTNIANDHLARRMLILLGFASLVSWIVRYRFLNMYDRLPPAPERKEPHIDLFADTRGDTKPGLANYLDEFLSAIKVFGYRE